MPFILAYQYALIFRYILAFTCNPKQPFYRYRPISKTSLYRYIGIDQFIKV